MRILSVDPSLVNIGVARIEDGQFLSSFTLRTKPDEALEDRLCEIAQAFESYRNYDIVVIELPVAQVYSRSGTRGQKNMRSMQMLHLAIGAIVGGLTRTPRTTKVVFFPVNEWKGKEDKRVTQHEARMVTGKKMNSHEADATIMGLRWYKRQLLTANMRDTWHGRPQ